MPAPDLEVVQTMTQQEFDSLVRPHMALLYRIAMSFMKNEENAADVLQDAMLKAWKSRDKMREVGNVKAWLCRIVERTALNDIRHKRAGMRDVRRTMGYEDVNAGDDAPTWEATADAHAEFGMSPERAAAVRQDTALLHRCLDQLPPDLRDTMVLVDVEKKTYDEAAAQLGISKGGVGKRLVKARAAFQEILARERAE